MQPCRYMRFAPVSAPEHEWVPMALRSASCLLRRSDPHRWASVLRGHGIRVEDDDIVCLHNAESSWQRCPLYQGRTPARDPDDDVPRNRFGFPAIC